jgi:peptidoglycan hydrolase-like protein with peptidoglycan-binding domain
MIQSKRLSANARLREVTPGKPLARGATGEPVAILQDLFSDLGYTFKISFSKGSWDGIFGAETEGVVRQFQKSKGLAADGMVGPMTLGALDLLILANPFLELIDFARYKSYQLVDRISPAEQRGNAYW